MNKKPIQQPDMIYKRHFLFLIPFVVFSFLLVFTPQSLSAQLYPKAWPEKKFMDSSIQVLVDILSIPNDAAFPQAIDRNIEWLDQQLSKRGFTVTLFPSPDRPFVFAEYKVDATLPTVLYYMHFDGQPVASHGWKQMNAYMPVFKKKTDTGWMIIPTPKLGQSIDPEWRIFARSSSDDKGPIAMFLAAIDMLRIQGKQPAYNVKLILDSEEEKGSPNLPAMVKQHRELLKADRLVILDGPRHNSNQPTLLFGCRGVADISLEVFGPRFDQHSGHYGNYAPNPALELSKLLVSMKDEKGQVLIPQFYKGITISEEVRKDLLAVPDKKQVINQQIGIAKEVNPDLSYQESLQYPSLNILNITSGEPEIGTRNIVPSFAKANVDIRLVPESDPKHIENIIRKFIREKGFYIIENRKPTEEERMKYPKIVSFYFRLSSLAFVTEPNSPTGLWTSAIVEKLFGVKPVKIRMSGGTVPIAPFIRELDIPAVLVPTVNPDNSQHAANENLRLANYFEGVQLVFEILRAGFK
jgi:acetylornithine deacetylase/succinyl-diaminopimelate desuccinylase-like protein